ncbi:MAG: AAA family ATPase [Thermoplasmata archaeon]|nr:AAA family ATPase [Thermoplasmata archaeon]
MKRVALAGVLVAGAEVLLLDEPTSGLDPRGERRLLKELKRHHRPMVVTTHSLEVAAELATEVVVLRKRIVMAGHPQEVLTDLKRLKRYGLRPPRVTEAFLRLGQHYPLTPPEAARLIKEFKS